MKRKNLIEVISLRKTLKSRFTFDVVETDIFENNLKQKYNVPDAAVFDEFI
jgi:hypothetical protein